MSCKTKIRDANLNYSENLTHLAYNVQEEIIQIQKRVAHASVKTTWLCNNTHMYCILEWDEHEDPRSR